MDLRSVKKHEWTAEQERLVLETHAKLGCGPVRLAAALPEIDELLLRAMFDRLGLGSKYYHQWSEEETQRLIDLHLTNGFGGKRLAAYFPGIKPAAINSKLSSLRNSGVLPRKKRKKSVRYTNSQHRQFRKFVIENRQRYRIPALTRWWNEIAAAQSIPLVNEDMVRYWARRKPAKHGQVTYQEKDFDKADEDARRQATLTHHREFEEEAAKVHLAAKELAAQLLAKKPSQSKICCRWCDTEFPVTDGFFKVAKGVLDTSACIWCRDRQRREYHFSRTQGPAAHKQYKMRMKREKRERLFDARWKQTKAERLKLRDKLRMRRKPPKEQICCKCEDSHPLMHPFYKVPRAKGKNYSRLCCFCDHDFRIRLKRAKADGLPTEQIIHERKAILRRQRREERQQRIANLKRKARSVSGPREPCKDCSYPWPIAKAHVRKFWRMDSTRSNRRRRCLPCDWEHDAKRGHL